MSHSNVDRIENKNCVGQDSVSSIMNHFAMPYFLLLQLFLNQMEIGKSQT
jgi:hypothetical protein